MDGSSYPNTFGPIIQTTSNCIIIMETSTYMLNRKNCLAHKTSPFTNKENKHETNRNQKETENRSGL